MKEYILGLDVGGTTVKCGLFPRGQRVEYLFAIPTYHGTDVAKLWKNIWKDVQDRLATFGLSKDNIKAIGMGLPGPIDDQGFLPRLVNVGTGACYPAKEMAALTGIPTAAGNDANVAALGEAKYGAGAGYKSVVLFTLGTGVGGGIIMDGQLIAGAHGVGGEVGHFVVNPDEKDACNCGNHGCLEQYASATGIARTARKLLKVTDVPSSLRALDRFTAKEVMDAAKEGDPVGLATLETFGKYLGIAIAHVVLTTDPDAVLLGGGVSKAGSILVDTVSKYVDQYTHIAEKRADILIASLGNDAGIYGAAALAESLL